MNQSTWHRWSLWHSVIGLALVVGAALGLWSIMRRPTPTATAPTALERKAQRLDEICRRIDADIETGQIWSTDPDVEPSTRGTLQVLGRLATLCHWDDAHPEAP